MTIFLFLVQILACADVEPTVAVMEQAVAQLQKELGYNTIALDPERSPDAIWGQDKLPDGAQADHSQMVVNAAQRLGIDTTSVGRVLACQGGQCTLKDYDAVFAVGELLFNQEKDRAILEVHIWTVSDGYGQELAYQINLDRVNRRWRVRRIRDSYTS